MVVAFGHMICNAADRQPASICCGSLRQAFNMEHAASFCNLVPYRLAKTVSVLLVVVVAVVVGSLMSVSVRSC